MAEVVQAQHEADARVTKNPVLESALQEERLKGAARGVLEGKMAALLAILSAGGLRAPKEAEQRLRKAADAPRLDRWLRSALVGPPAFDAAVVQEGTCVTEPRGGNTAVQLTARGPHTCAVLDDGSVKCWGDNNYGELGLGDTQLRGDEPGEMGDHLPAVSLF